MSKEISTIELANVATEAQSVEAEVTQLDDLALALVGGGNAVVTF